MSAWADIRIAPVPVGLVPAMLPYATPHLAKGIAVSDLDMVELVSGLWTGTTVLWCVFERDQLAAALFTTRYQEPDRPVVHVYGLGGAGIQRWLKPLDAAMSRHATENGCDAFRFHGRAAWRRVMPQAQPIETAGRWTLYERKI